ncbi:MAG TPA: PhzF family phenazine biosynthesis protein [Burkholderiales bacterium]|jgi:PhzF family phenazine biosynthesis protein|nr:PhzF family phenazine biosynthesis protein [Burkholderiales bacterium]
MATLPFKQVDVFTGRPFYGNPVAVVIGADGLAPEEMQRIAGWTNLSETTFLLAPSAPGASYRLRIFTPRQELPFAGHPTVGSAHAALESGFAKAVDGKLKQECGAGVLDLAVEAQDSARRIFVKAPAPRITPVAAPLFGKARALRIDVGPVWVVVDLGDARNVDTLEPDMAAITELSHSLEASGATVFGRTGNAAAPIHVRSFAPAHGIPEDPVCGSGNISVAAYLRETGLLKEFGPDYTARQGMQVGRDGRVQVRVSADAIRIGGEAVTCVDGKLRVR